MARTPKSGQRPPQSRAGRRKPDAAPRDDIPPAGRESAHALSDELQAYFSAPGGVALADAIGRLATPEDRAEADKAYAEMLLRENLHRSSLLSAGLTFISITDPEEHARWAKTERLAQSVMPWLQHGVLIAYGNVDGASIGQDFPAAEWRGEWDLWFADQNMAQRSTEPKTKIENIRVRVPAAAAVSDKGPKRGGRPPDDDWPDIMSEWLEILLIRGKPKSKAEARDWVRAAAKRESSSLRLEKDETIDAHMIRTFGKKFWDGIARKTHPPKT